MSKHFSPDARRSYRTEPVKIGAGFSVAFHLADGRMEALWSPTTPEPELGRCLLPTYRFVRQRFLEAVERDGGPRVLVVEDLP
jgi:hypothetical protein